MAVTLAKSDDEIKKLPLVELAFELLKANKDPVYFRDIMSEIRKLRSMTDNEALDVIARLYTEINIDGRFIHLGQNVWGLKRWFPTEKANERPQSSKRFVRSSGDAFSDDDELDDYDEEESSAPDDSDDEDNEKPAKGFDDADSTEDYDASTADDDDTEEADDSDEEFDGDDEELEDEFADETDEDEEAYPDDELDDADPENEKKKSK